MLLRKQAFNGALVPFVYMTLGSVCVRLAIRFCHYGCWQDLSSCQQIITNFSQVWSSHQRLCPVKRCSLCGMIISYQVTDIMKNTSLSGTLQRLDDRGHFLHESSWLWLRVVDHDPASPHVSSEMFRCGHFSSAWPKPETNCVRGRIKSQEGILSEGNANGCFFLKDLKTLIHFYRFWRVVSFWQLHVI